MSDNLGTQLDRGYTDADTRTAALRRISREADGDVLADMLGLAGPAPEPIGPACPLCGRPRLRDKPSGFKPCRRKACLGEAS